ncbi:MAG: DUF2807 domain-containing protein [Firmicutes bacterium]|nr:DUF2807 domain-containing protein [Bacillota bacterium]
MVSKKLNLLKKAGILAILIIAAVLVLSACNINAIRGNGKMENLELSVTEDIKKIEFKNVSATLKVSAEASDKVTYKVDENLKDYLVVEIESGVLRIYSTNNKTLGINNRIEFNVGTEKLEEIKISGGVEVVGSGTFNADTFKIDVKGAVNLSLNLNCNKLITNLDGAVETNLFGTANTVEVKVAGAVNFSSKELTASDVNINFSGACSLGVYASNTLVINGSGTGSVDYWGNPTVSGSTSGAITKKSH